MSVTPQTRTVRTLDVPLGPGRQTVRLALVGPGNDEEAALVVSIGFGGGMSGDPFTRPPWADRPLLIPAECIPAIREALATLANVEAGP